MARSLFTKADDKDEPEAGSAQRAAAQLHGSAYVHAIRYGERGSKEFKRAYDQHIGRFLSCVRAAGRVSKSADEARDARGRWATGGSIGQAAGAVKNMVRAVLDSASDYQPGDRRSVKYMAAAVARGTGGLGVPGDVADMAQFHIANATGHVVNRVLSSKAMRRLSAGAAKTFRKSLAPEECAELKELVAKAVAELHFPPQLAGSDQAIRQVAVGAYRHCRTRLETISAQSR